MATAAIRAAKRGLALPDEVAPHLRAGDGMLFAWHTEPVAPWQGRALVGGDAALAAAVCVSAHDHERVRVAGIQVHQSECVGCLCAAIAGAGAEGPLAQCLDWC